MVERYRRAKGKKPLLGSHERCWIWGRHVVLETLRAGRWIPWEMYLSHRLPADELTTAKTLAEPLSVTLLIEPHEELTRRCHSSEHQGYLAKMPPFPYADAEQTLAELPPAPFCAILDGMQDPHNFGAVLRSADGLGVDAVFVGKAGQVRVTSLVTRASAGAVNHVRLVEVDDLSKLADTLKQHGHRVIAATEKARTSPMQADFRSATTIVIGNEGGGIHQELLAVCDEQIAIPQVGHVGSLNAAVSAGILFYEARRQRTRD